MIEENNFCGDCCDTEYLTRLSKNKILVAKVDKHGRAKVSVKPVRLKPDGSIEYMIEYLPKHRNNQEED